MPSVLGTHGDWGSRLRSAQQYRSGFPPFPWVLVERERGPAAVEFFRDWESSFDCWAERADHYYRDLAQEVGTATAEFDPAWCR